MADRIALGVMARAASDDRGKTRLVRALGIDDGADLRRAILLDTLEAIRPVGLADRIVLFTPDDARSEVAGLGADVAHLMPQRGETLSQRLEHADSLLVRRRYSARPGAGSGRPPSSGSAHHLRAWATQRLPSSPAVSRMILRKHPKGKA